MALKYFGCRSEDPRGARTWFFRAAEAGQVDGLVTLAEMMLNGRGGSPAPALALDLFKRAAAKNHSGAMFALGAIYNGGHNLPTDRRAAQHWFRAAAEAGHGQAQMMLGRYLTRGLAGDIDLVEGRQWLERAVEQGITEAELDLGGAGDADALVAPPSSNYLKASDFIPIELSSVASPVKKSKFAADTPRLFSR